MKKTVYVIILVVLTLTAIFLGLFIHVLGGNITGILNLSSYTSEVKEEKVEISDEITGISVDLDATDISIEYGDSAYVEYCLPENMVPGITVEDGILTIKTPKNKGFKITPMQIKDMHITVVIPEGVRLEEATIDTDAGNVSIVSIEADDLSVDVDAGNISINGINASNVIIDTDAGNVELQKCIIDILNVDADMGNVSLKDSTVSVISAELDAGNIESFGCTIAGGNVETDLGNISLHGEIGKVNTKTSLGNVEVER